MHLVVLQLEMKLAAISPPDVETFRAAQGQYYCESRTEKYRLKATLVPVQGQYTPQV